VGVAVGQLDLEDTLLHLQYGDVKGSATQIVNGNDGAVRTVKSTGEGGSCRLADDTEHVETDNLTSVLGSLSLGFVEVGRHSGDGMTERTMSGT
jgi:hypothetical protein